MGAEELHRVAAASRQQRRCQIDKHHPVTGGVGSRLWDLGGRATGRSRVRGSSASSGGANRGGGTPAYQTRDGGRAAAAHGASGQARPRELCQICAPPILRGSRRSSEGGTGSRVPHAATSQGRRWGEERSH